MAKNRLPETEQGGVSTMLPDTIAPGTVTPEKPGRKQMSPEEKKARQEAYKLEAKDAKFIRLAKKRGIKAVKAIRQLAHLANRSQYEWTPEQAANLVKNLANEINALQGKFAGNKTNGVTFTL